MIFAKAPRAGLVKTRLAASVGEEEALRAYRWLLRRVAERVKGIGTGVVCFAPVDGESGVRPFFPAEWRFSCQVGATLGERLQHALASSFGRGVERVAVIGSDCPYLLEDDIEEAWRRLDDHDVVFGPAEDGGYWLVAMKALHSDLFVEIEWGTERVLEQSLARVKELKLKAHLLRRLADVDTERDWRQFLVSCQK